MRVRLFFLLCLTGLTGCSSLPGVQYLSKFSFMSPYKMDIRQGNSFDEKQVDRLQLGMTHAQVQFIMGTPLISDVFHANRWDYIYSLQHDGKLVETHRVTLYFDQGKLTRIIKEFGGAPVVIEAQTATEEAPATQAPATQAPATQTPATQAPATQAPASQVPVTPATQVPVTQTPATQTPATQTPATQTPATASGS